MVVDDAPIWPIPMPLPESRYDFVVVSFSIWCLELLGGAVNVRCFRYALRKGMAGWFGKQF